MRLVCFPPPQLSSNGFSVDGFSRLETSIQSQPNDLKWGLSCYLLGRALANLESCKRLPLQLSLSCVRSSRSNNVVDCDEHFVRVERPIGF